MMADFIADETVRNLIGIRFLGGCAEYLGTAHLLLMQHGIDKVTVPKIDNQIRRSCI